MNMTSKLSAISTDEEQPMKKIFAGLALAAMMTTSVLAGGLDAPVEDEAVSDLHHLARPARYVGVHHTMEIYCR